MVCRVSSSRWDGVEAERIAEVRSNGGCNHNEDEKREGIVIVIGAICLSKFLSVISYGTRIFRVLHDKSVDNQHLLKALVGVV